MRKGHRSKAVLALTPELLIFDEEFVIVAYQNLFIINLIGTR